MLIRVARDRDLFEQIGRDIYVDLVDHDRVRTFHVKRQAPFSRFKETIAQEFGIPVQFQRFWKWKERENKTYRPYEPIALEEESIPVGELKETSRTELNLFLEVELDTHGCPVCPPVKSRKDILVFFKHYDPEKGALRYVGRLFVKSYAKPNDILGKLNKMAGFGPDEKVVLYEELKFESSVECMLIDTGLSFEWNGLLDGDIICIQKEPCRGAGSCRYPTVTSFLEHIRACQMMGARNLPSEIFTWKISNFSKLTPEMCHSEVFTLSGCTWHILIYPKGNNTDSIALYIKVTNAAPLPIGWSRTIKCSLTVVSQKGRALSVTQEASREFNGPDIDCGFPSFMTLTELHDPTKGYLEQDTLVVEAYVEVLEAITPVVSPDAVRPPSGTSSDAYVEVLEAATPVVSPDAVRPPSGTSSDAYSAKAYVEVIEAATPVVSPDAVRPPSGTSSDAYSAKAYVEDLDAVTPVVSPDAVRPPSGTSSDAYSAKEMDRFVSYISSLDELIGASETSVCKQELSSRNRTSRTVSLSPSSKEVNSAVLSLKKCLSGHFKMSMKDRLASALSTLSMAETGLLPEQRKSVLEFLVHFDNFISDYLSLQKDSSVYEIQKLQNDILFSAMKKDREVHLSNKESLEKLFKEEEELKKKLDELTQQLEETRGRKSKLILDWEALVADSEETKSEYVSKKPKLAQAEERMRIAEERISSSTSAWSTLKASFL